MLCTIQLKIPNAFYRWMNYNIFLSSPWAYFCWCYIDFWHTAFTNMNCSYHPSSKMCYWFSIFRRNTAVQVLFFFYFPSQCCLYIMVQQMTAVPYNSGHFPSQSSNSVLMRITSHLQLQSWFKKDQTMKRNCLGQMTQENPVQAVSCSVLLGNTKGNTLVFLVKLCIQLDIY